MRRLWRHALAEEYVAYGIGIRVAAHQTRDRVAGDVSALAAGTKAPTELSHTVIPFDDSAAMGLVLARQSRSPGV